MKKHTGKENEPNSSAFLPEHEDNRLVINAVRIIFGLLMALIFWILLFKVDVEYIYVRNHQTNIPLLFLGASFLAILFFLISQLARKIALKNERLPLLIFSIGFLILQCVWIYSYYFRTAWDVNHLLSIAEAILEHPGYMIESYYLSMYPNNRLLVWLFVFVGKTLQTISPNTSLLFTLIELQCVLFWISSILLYQTVVLITKKKATALWAYVVYLLIIGCSPWLSIPYSDSMCLIFPVLTMYLYVRKDLRFRWFWIGVLAIIGYKIKPQTLIMNIAIIIVQMFSLIDNRKTKGLVVKVMDSVTLCAAGVLLGFLFVSITAGRLPVEVEDRTMEPSHYLMMGLNNLGGYSDTDVEFSYSFDDPELRRESELAVAKERLTALGVSGYLKLLHSKLLSAYNDGTFFWGGEGMFYYQLTPEKGKLSELSRDIYYSDTGSRYSAWSNLAQALWIGLLLFAAISFLFRGNRYTAVLSLTIIGLTLFELLFEVRSRHLIFSIPVFIMAAAYSCSELKTEKKQQAT